MICPGYMYTAAYEAHPAARLTTRWIMLVIAITKPLSGFHDDQHVLLHYVYTTASGRVLFGHPALISRQELDSETVPSWLLLSRGNHDER